MEPKRKGMNQICLLYDKLENFIIIKQFYPQIIWVKVLVHILEFWKHFIENHGQ